MKKYFFLAVVFLTLGVMLDNWFKKGTDVTVMPTTTSETLVANKELVKKSFEIFSKDSDTEEFAEEYYADDYIQTVGAVKLSRDDFIQHVDSLKKDLASIDFTFDHMLAEGNLVSTMHRAKAMTEDGEEVEVRVFAVFTIEANRIKSVDELTYVIKGKKKHEDLGTRINPVHAVEAAEDSQAQEESSNN